jgi:ATP-dependent exoDNAse (exonuclease V) beta subunit
LYVAATRTQRQLHLIASVKINQNGEIKPAARTLLKVLWPAVETEFINTLPMRNVAGYSEVLDISHFNPQLQRLDSVEFSGQSPANFLATFSNKTSIFANSVTSPYDSEASLIDSTNVNADMQRHCGTLAHLYMALFSSSDLQDWQAERLAACLPAMRKWLVLQGHALGDSQLAAAQVLAALQLTLASKAGQWVLHKHTNAASELSLMQATDVGIKNHVIDRTFVECVNGENIRWIVDYKLTISGETLDLAVVAEQHRPQLARYESLFLSEALKIKTAVLFLSSGELFVL